MMKNILFKTMNHEKSYQELCRQLDVNSAEISNLLSNDMDKIVDMSLKRLLIMLSTGLKDVISMVKEVNRLENEIRAEWPAAPIEWVNPEGIRSSKELLQKIMDDKELVNKLEDAKEALEKAIKENMDLKTKLLKGNPSWPKNSPCSNTVH